MKTSNKLGKRGPKQYQSILYVLGTFMKYCARGEMLLQRDGSFRTLSLELASVGLFVKRPTS